MNWNWPLKYQGTERSNMARLRLNVESRDESFFYKGNESKVKVGRSMKCEFNIPKDDLSREHCLVELEGEDYFISDLGSKNGISVNGEKLAPFVKTKISEESTVVLSNIYYLKVNPIAVKTKAEILLKRINPEIDTRTFQIDLPAEKLVPEVKKIKRLPKKKDTAAETPKQESMKMIIGFLLILGFVIYQALGR